MLDIPRVAALAHEHDLPLMVDSTFTTPYLLQPFDHGADLVFHSATKFLCGHGTAHRRPAGRRRHLRLAARACAHSGRFAELCEPYAGFHGMVFAEESTVGAFALRARREGLRDFGAVMSPHNAFAILQGVETLGLRMERHVANTRKVVEFLARHPAVESVVLSGTGQPPRPRAGHDPAAARLRRRVLVHPAGGDRAAGRRFVDALQLFSHLANVGDAKSLVIHPASTTHFRVPAEQLAAAASAKARCACRSAWKTPTT